MWQHWLPQTRWQKPPGEKIGRAGSIISLGGIFKKLDMRSNSIDDAVTFAIPIDFRPARIFAGGDARVFDAVGHDVIVFEEGGMAVAKGDVAAFVVPGGEARRKAVRGGQDGFVGSRAVI